MHRCSLAVLLICGVPGCGAPAAACPSGYVSNEERARALVNAARGTRAGREVVGDGVGICFGGHERGSVLPDGVVVISDGLTGGEAAARLIHLRTHVAEGLHNFPAVGVACDRQMEGAIAAEARAIVAEIEACAELRCTEQPYGFAAEVLAAAAGERVAGVLARLRDEPEGDGLDVMLGRYRARCDEAQRGSDGDGAR
jgi:hypothetical protein